jgi:cell division protein FtsB
MPPTVPQNYETLKNLGAYKVGSVLPEWAVERAGPVAEQVARGIVRATDKPVNVDVRVPEPKVATDTAPAAADEANRLRRENEQLAESNKGLVQQVAALKGQLEARDKSLGAQTEAIEGLKATCESLRAENARLVADLEAATEPVAA